MEYYIRFSNHIQEDLKRGWSSWNFGKEGFEGTDEQLEEYKKDCFENENPMFISAFELWGDDIFETEIKELYPDYWVVVDERVCGISASEIKASSLEEAIKVFSQEGYNHIDFGDESGFFPEKAKHVLSCKDNEIHLFVVE